MWTGGKRDLFFADHAVAPSSVVGEDLGVEVIDFNSDFSPGPSASFSRREPHWEEGDTSKGKCMDMNMCEIKAILHPTVLCCLNI